MLNQYDVKSILSRKHWIFDLDGTLTVAVHDFKAIKEALEIPPEVNNDQVVCVRAVWRRLGIFSPKSHR